MAVRREYFGSSLCAHPEATPGTLRNLFLRPHFMIFLQLHRQRVRFMQDDPSGFATPVTPMFPSSGANTPPGPKDITEEHFR
jgi:hypothetical protein